VLRPYDPQRSAGCDGEGRHHVVMPTGMAGARCKSTLHQKPHGGLI